MTYTEIIILISSTKSHRQRPKSTNWAQLMILSHPNKEVEISRKFENEGLKKVPRFATLFLKRVHLGPIIFS